MKKGNIYLQTIMQIKTKPLFFNTLRIFYLQKVTHNGFTAQKSRIFKIYVEYNKSGYNHLEQIPLLSTSEELIYYARNNVGARCIVPR